MLRNGWYTENDTASVPVAVARGEVIGASGDGRFSTAARADYAAAAVAVLIAPHIDSGRVYELAGDAAYTRAEFAAHITQLSGSPVRYRNVMPDEYAASLIAFGLPAQFAGLIAEGDAGAQTGALFDDGRALSALIGRATTPVATSFSLALDAAKAPAAGA